MFRLMIRVVCSELLGVIFCFDFHSSLVALLGVIYLFMFRHMVRVALHFKAVKVKGPWLEDIPKM